MANEVEKALQEKLGTKVNIGRIDLGFLNRIIIDDIAIRDQRGDSLLNVSRASVKFDYIPLTKGKISISSAQLFGAKFNLYKQSADAKTNFQFIIDSLASKDKTKPKKPIDIHIGSLIIRNGQLIYNQLDKAPTQGLFSTYHINAKDISAHIIINALKQDSLNLNIKKIAAIETSGLNINKLSFIFVANNSKATLSNFLLELPKSKCSFNNITATYKRQHNKILLPTLQYEGKINDIIIYPNDLRALLPKIKNINETLYMNSDFKGTATEFHVKSLNASNKNKTASLSANAFVFNLGAKPQWTANIISCKISQSEIKKINDAIQNKVDILTRAGNIALNGYVGISGERIVSSGTIKTDAGYANFRLLKYVNNIKAHINTPGLDLGRLISNKDFGNISVVADILARPTSKGSKSISVKGDIPSFTYKSYTFKSINLDGDIVNGILNGKLDLNDINGKLAVQGHINTNKGQNAADITVIAQKVNPQAWHIINKWYGTNFSFNAHAKVSGNSLNTANGFINLTNLTMANSEEAHTLDSVHVSADTKYGLHHISLRSDFADINFAGKYDYSTISKSITHLIGHYLPTLPGLKKNNNITHNDFSINAVIRDAWWINKFAGLDAKLSKPMKITGKFSDNSSQINMDIDAPAITYNGKYYENGFAHLQSLNDTLKVKAHLRTIDNERKGYLLSLNANAANNRLNAVMNFDNLNKKRIRGKISTSSQFFKNEDGLASAHIVFNNSDIVIGDTTWHVHPSDIIYCKNKIIVDHFSASHASQHIICNGIGTTNNTDSLFIDMKDVDVAYILDMVNFHSVDFGGKATGRIYIADLFSKPKAKAKLTVNDFTFETGALGTLHANVEWNNEKGQIDIDALAKEEPNRTTKINGYVSLAKNYIDLGIYADNSSTEFLKSFCGSFMDNIDASANGALHVVGDLKQINLVGLMTATGAIRIKPLNVTYKLNNDTIRFVPNEIEFPSDTIYDKYGNIGIVTGAVHHHYIKQMSYDVNIQAKNILAYDTHSFDDGTFYGTAYATGTCSISGKSGEVNIDVSATANKGSEIVYNASSPDIIGDYSFIHWKNTPKVLNENRKISNVDSIYSYLNPNIAIDSIESTIIPIYSEDQEDIDIPTNIHMNLAINCNPDASLRILMNPQSGDYITLNGTGRLHASWFNKGTFTLYGNYVVDHGTYNLTIQNAIKRDFHFLQGGTISFGGDPFNAAIDLQAQYTANGVSLADLSLGRSFSSGNITVNCIMNITGTPKASKVDFTLDLPNVNNDAKQMVMNLINSEEEMNQQVIYILAIGRFYNQNGNNAAAENAQRQSQTSLAMQSLLSGTISQQITNMLSSALNLSNWNFGANISTGTEGFNNAEYEGILSGRILNNRLLFNGQFGYRNNANATNSFIGDFDMQYLLMPNGNLSINVYNKTNDRYFTRNSLNTQGIGLKMQKEFSTLSDLFGRKRLEKERIKKQK
jgi:hypothetical protein